MTDSEKIVVNFIIFKKVTKNDEIFTVYLTLCSKCQIDGEDLSIFLAFLEDVNFIAVYVLKTLRKSSPISTINFLGASFPLDNNN